MKNFFNNPLIAFLSSLKLGAVLIVAMGVACGFGTFIESFYGGRDAAYDKIYAAGWFELVLGLIMVNLTLTFFKRMPYSGRQTGAALIHCSVVVILLAASVTRFYGYEGVVPIREGRSTDFYYTMRPHVQLQAGGEIGSYPARLYSAGDPGLQKDVVVGGKTYELGVSGYWPNFTETYQAGPGGRPGFRYESLQPGASDRGLLFEGNRKNFGKARAWFRHSAFAGDLFQATDGELQVLVGNSRCVFPVGQPNGTVHKCGGYGFEVVGFETHEIDGPLVRVVVTTPNGKTGEKTLWAYGTGTDQGDDLTGFVLDYVIESGIEFYHDRETGLVARATYPVTALTAGAVAGDVLAAGEVFAVHEQTHYTNDALAFSLRPVMIMDSVVLAPSNSGDADLPSAARLWVRDAEGNQEMAICLKGETLQRVKVGGVELKLAFGPLMRPLPYSLFLDRFHLETYPGSDNPATFESFILLTDPQLGLNREKVHISMNNPLTHRGSKHFQSSYDNDRKGTVLTLNHDPGKWPTYFGYSLLCLGFIFFLLQNVLWPRKKKTVEAVLLLLVLGAMGGASVAAADEQPGMQADGFVVLTDHARTEAGRLLVQDYRGRMKPLDTLAREFVMKIAKKTKFEGRQPVDMYLNWVANSDQWWDKPCIAVRYPGLKDLLGVDPATKHVSSLSLVANGKYRISGQVEKALRTPDRDRSKTQRKLLSFDERANLLYMTFQGTTLRMYPLPGDANNTWLEIKGVTPSLTGAQAHQFNTTYNDLVNGLRTGDNVRILGGIRGLAAVQAQYGAAVIPGDLKLGAELFYNKAHLFSWMMVPLLGTFFLFIALFLWNLFRNRGARFSFRNPLYSLAMFAYTFAFGGMVLAYTLRWIASGRAPLSNGHESLLFISLAAALAGLVFELVFRLAAPAGLASLLTVLILGVSMLSVFDPAIGPLVPVLASYWLNIHVTIITASYSFLGLAFMVGLLIMVLMIIRSRVARPTQINLDGSIKTLDQINFWILAVGLGTLSVGTLLGGVWANEAWGRYWGWDPKETWSLITILVVVIGLHFRYLPKTKGAWSTSAWTWMVFNSVVMTYFGVNYFLVGLHSYASGDAPEIPGAVYVFTGLMVALIAISGVLNIKYKKTQQYLNQ